MSEPEQKHELISYNKKFKPGTSGVKLTFSPDEMAFSREDMPLKAAIARREVLLSLQPQIDGVNRRSWNGDVQVILPHEPYNPHDIHVSKKDETEPHFRKDFYDSSLPWDIKATIDKKLEARRFGSFTQSSKENSSKKCEKVASTPPLVKRQIEYAKFIKDNGIPAAQAPPPFIQKKPQMSKGSKKRIHNHDQIQSYHDGKYGYNEALGGNAWSCCGNADQNSEGCKQRRVNTLSTLYD